MRGPMNTFLTWQAVANCSGSAFVFPPSSSMILSITFNPYKFGVFMSGLYKYNFLSTTVCEVVPYLTTVNVTYNGDVISVDQIGSSYMYSVLEGYWRGITEFSSTQLRSRYSATGHIPSNMTTSTSGTLYITTYGWRSQSHTFILLLVLITMIWGTTVLAAGYSLVQEKYNASEPFFDFSEPIHLIIAASGGGLEEQLHGHDRNLADNSYEDLTVLFADVYDKDGGKTGKKLVSLNIMQAWHVHDAGCQGGESSVSSDR
ncbi:hypothetical protein EDB19DRAFT_378973 [Suillus lakei]|nr:hypothetical protein EDB19DRAFT_378973 [Suillus lakei]